MHRLGVLLAVLGLSSAASANVEVGGTAGVHIFSDDNSIGVKSTNPNPTSEKNSALFALRLGYYFNKALGIEVEGGIIPTEPRSVVFDLYNLVYRAQVVYQFRTEDDANAFVPFVLVGGGAVQLFKTQNPDVVAKDTNGEIYVGAGVKYRANGGWGVRADIRVIGTGGTDPKFVLDYEGLVSLYHEWGRTKPAPKKDVVVAPPVNDDPDGDGIHGAADKCPNDPEDKDGFQDEDGCPDPDNDGDGIPDDKDKCPKDAEDKDGFQDEDGCPDLDNDGDGIPDAQDKCPGEPETKNGYMDDDGCPDEIPEKLKKFSGAIQGITFKVNSADLVPSSFATLDKAVAVLAEYVDVKLEIQGHTDDQPLVAHKGSKFATNLELSQARAETVRDYIVKKGVSTDRLTAKGYGDTVPVTDPKGLKGAALNKAREQNRRVEFKLVSNPGTMVPAVPVAPAAATPTP